MVSIVSRATRVVRLAAVAAVAASVGMSTGPAWADQPDADQSQRQVASGAMHWKFSFFECSKNDDAWIVVHE